MLMMILLKNMRVHQMETEEMTILNSPEDIDSSTLTVLPTPTIHLKTIDDVRLEMAKVYRDMKFKKIAANDGTRLVYVLGQIGRMIELHDIEMRLDVLEAKNESKK